MMRYPPLTSAAPIAQLGERQTLDRKFNPHLGRSSVLEQDTSFPLLITSWLNPKKPSQND